MTSSYKDAYQTLLTAQKKLNSQDISVLDQTAQLGLLQAQREIYLEIQALQVRRMTGRTDQFVALTQGFRKSEAAFRKIQSWAKQAEKTGATVNNLLKGASLILSLL